MSRGLWHQKDILTKQEGNVLRELCLGLSNKQIAEKLFVCDKTIRFHLTNIYKKLGVTHRGAAIIKVTKEGLNGFAK